MGEADAPPPPPKWELATSLGAMAPLGSFDPLGFSDSEETFKDLRAKELKHGRLAMMGAVGLLVQSIVQVPGMEGVPKNIFAITQGNGLIGGVAILAIIGVLEAVVCSRSEEGAGELRQPVASGRRRLLRGHAPQGAEQRADGHGLVPDDRPELPRDGEIRP